MDSRKILIGDVHGCFEELLELMNILRPVPEDRFIFLGDLIDRGPMTEAVVAFVMDLEAECLFGNHEEKYVRYMKHDRKHRADSAYKNPMQPPVNGFHSLSYAQLVWLEQLPTYLTFEHAGRPWIAVHAGFASNAPYDKQSRNAVIRTRYLKPDGKPTSQPYVLPPGAVYWTERWQGPQSVIYGHNVNDLVQPRIDRPVPDVMCAGIDTGCCFGGSLTAAVFLPGDVEPTFVSVPAKRVYFSSPTDAAEAEPT